MAQATEKFAVQMSDGRTVGFGARQQCVKEVLRRADTQEPIAVRFNLRNGVVHSCDVDQLDQKVIAELVAHGIKQKVGDEGAKEKVTSPSDFADQIAAMIQRLYDGTAFTRTAGTRQDPDLDLARALSEWKGDKTEAEALEFLKDKSKAQKQALRLVPEVKAILDRLEKERAQDVDGEELLAGW